MKLVKTELGQRVLKDRSVPLSPRQRAAFILFDGKTAEQVLASTAAMGVTRDDVDYMLQQGLLEPVAGTAAAPAPPAASDMPMPVPGAPLDVPLGTTGILLERTPQQRYQDAYPIATKLTASLGLRGFRLNLAVEGALNYEQLRELAPRIKDAVGEKAFAELDRALNA
jgi:hypothetical protein